MYNFLYSLTMCLLHYYPRRVSSINMPIFRKHVEDNSVTDTLLMNKENCALKLVDEIILYYDTQSKKHQIMYKTVQVITIRNIISIKLFTEDQR